MKKIFLFLLVGFFAVVVAACSQLPTLESIELSGQDVEFYVGEEFNTGDLKVVAKLSDASTEDVTAQATVSQEADMSKAGTYTVIVSYKGLTQSYEIKVVDDKVVSLEAENLKAEYKIGETVSFEGAIAKETYESGKVADADLASYEVVLVAAGKEYTGAFAKVGENTVKLVKGECVYEYKVNVSANLYASIADAVAAGVKNADKVASGNATIDNDGYVNANTYEFGENYTKVANENETYYYSLLEDGAVFGLVEGINWEGNPYIEPAYEPLETNLLGVDFRAVLNYSYDMYGVEALVDTFALVAQSESALNYKEVLPVEVQEENTYAFSFEIVIDDFYYYFIEVNFTLNAETEVISSALINMKGYMFIYDDESGEYVQPTEFAETPDFTRIVTVSQEVGERDAVNPYPAEDLLIQSFDVLDAEGNKLENGAELVAPMKETLLLNVGNLLPETANASVDQIKLTFTDAEGFETWSVFGDYYEGVISITAYKVGTYNVTIASTSVSYTFKLSVAYSELTELNAAVYDNNYYELVIADSATIYVGQVLQFGAIVNDGANPGVKATVENGTIVEGYEFLEFSSETAGEYVINLESVVNPELTATIKVTVKEAPSVAEILNGKYQFSSMMLGTAIYEFVPESEGAVKGQLTIAYEGAYVGTGEGYFSYEYAAGYLSVMPLNPGSYNCPFSVELGDQFNLVCLYNGWGQGDLVKVEETEAVEGALSGNYNATFVHPMNGMEFAMVFTFAVDGTGSYSLMNGAYEGSFKYANVEGVVTFSDVVAVFGAAVELSATVNGSVLTAKTVFTDAANELELEYLGVAQEENTVTTTPVVGENKVNASYWGNAVTFTAEEAGTYTITVDETVAILMIEVADVWYQPTATVTLEAGQALEIVVLLAVSGEDQVITLTIAK